VPDLREASEVAVVGDDVGAVLDRQSRELSVGDEVARSAPSPDCGSARSDG
jgi:hypothetical protein